MTPSKGISSLSDLSISEKYQNLGSRIADENQDRLQTQLQVFQNALISFKSEYAEEIIKNSEIRNAFSEICVAFGIDPLAVASSFDETSDASVKIERLNQLSLKLIEICNMTRGLNGGIISVDEILNLINNDTWVNNDLHFKFSSKDVLDALNHLSILGNELQLIRIGKHDYIKSVPHELNMDEKSILETSEVLGYVSVRILRDNFRWKKIRCKTTIDELVTNGILWVDTQDEDGEIKYWNTSKINSL